MIRNIVSITAKCLLIVSSCSVPASDIGVAKSGQQIYEYYCYQCHGYRGDANTTAARYVTPRPANFNSHTPRSMSRERMVNAVTYGISGTAMVGFSTVLSESDIKSVVDYIRERFMTHAPPVASYHTEVNGWSDFSNTGSGLTFQSGGIGFSTTVSETSTDRRTDLRIYQSLCISCHELNSPDEDASVWQLYSVSYPPGNYEEGELNPNSPIPAYEIHEQSPDISSLTPAERAGQELFQKMCAHCHAENGSGKSWVGRFLIPAPRDIRDSPLIKPERQSQLLEVIKLGLPGTSMPAWKNSLNKTQTDQLVAYLQHFARSAGNRARAQ